jgi:predicted alpha/beta superfamily hydrolase
LICRLLLVLVVLCGAAAAPCRAEPLPGGERLTLSSTILGQERTIYVSLPASYGRSTEAYPVLYLTDAQWQFEQVRSASNLLARNGLTPEVIIVGVTNPDRTSDLYATRAVFKDGARVIDFPTSGHADQFADFLERELIPWTEAHYRTTPLRILAGHSAGGNFALHVMRTRPALFQAIIAASPWLAWDEGKELQQLIPFVAGQALKARMLFLSYASEGAEMKANLDTLAAALGSRKDGSLRWKLVAYPDETHDSTPLKSYYDGLRTIFAGWSYPRDPKSNALVGALDDLRAYYAKIGDRLGVPLTPSESLVNELGRQDIKAGALNAAVADFRYNTDQHPRSARAWDSLGAALEQSEKKDEALACYRKAVSLGEASGIGDLKGIRDRLAHLEGETKAEGR